MNITKLQWVNPEHTFISINGGEATIPWPCQTWHKAAVDAFLSNGGIILAAKPSDDHTYTGVDSDDPVVMWAIDLATYKAKKRLAINAEAGRRITGYYGLADGKQANMQKRGLELIRKRALGLPLSDPETAEENVLLSAGLYIDAVRAAARAGKAAVTAATSVAEVDAVTVTWPAETPPDWPL